ncbi:MAG: hypothetical protein Q8934_01570 [Bacillota bacterium]|nr:hypothetical protein [Bacillota bacterium]
MESPFEGIMEQSEKDNQFFEQFQDEFLKGNIDNLSYYELTELVQQFHMRKL